jgi:hypothetical protein
MNEQGWEATAYYEDDEVVMLLLEVEGMGSAFRYDGEWHAFMPEDMDLSDSDVAVIRGEDVREVVERYDEKDPSLIDFLKEFEVTDEEPVTAAASSACPPATQDIGLNLENRKNAIDTAMYGPLNPAEPNDEYWQALADEWSVDVETAKQQRCGNCAVFNISPSMKDCIASGLTDNADDFDLIDSAGEFGYCEAFDFKCASARTCRAWVGGGPITEDTESGDK